ncbi:MAG: hypothetical protein LUH42_03405 [Oscillospiraceae bacterium]|nr:hypothetical protein [Oscillospiraceae bacterium]
MKDPLFIWYEFMHLPRAAQGGRAEKWSNEPYCQKATGYYNAIRALAQEKVLRKTGSKSPEDDKTLFNGVVLC